LWARLVIDELANGSDFNPQPLETLYANAMTRIEDLSEQEKSFAKTTLAWVLLAKRPLEEAELRHVLAIEDGSPGLDQLNIPDVIQVITSCRPFLNSLERDRIHAWVIVHQSATDYLLRTLDTWCPDAQALVTKGCLTYLAFDKFSEGHCRTKEQLVSRLEDYPFYRYASQYWVHHLHEIQDVPENIVCSFLLDKNKIASARQAMLTPRQEPQGRGFGQAFDEHETGLHLAAQFGLQSVITLLLEKGQRPTVKDTQGRTPLWRATEKCRIEAMKLLSSWDRTSFTLMLNKNQEQLAHSLLRITGQNIKDSRSRNPLHIGVLRNDLELIRLSINHGLDIDTMDMDGHAPIHLAIKNQASQTIDLLLNNAARTDRIVAGDWSQAYGKSASDIVKLVEDANGNKQVTFVAAENFKREGPTSETRKRLL
jgi:hypothetical protein